MVLQSGPSGADPDGAGGHYFAQPPQPPPQPEPQPLSQPVLQHASQAKRWRNSRLHQLSFSQQGWQQLSQQEVVGQAGAQVVTVTGTMRQRLTQTSSGTHTFTFRQTVQGTHSVTV
jgi:hypothetical protein